MTKRSHSRTSSIADTNEASRQSDDDLTEPKDTSNEDTTTDTGDRNLPNKNDITVPDNYEVFPCYDGAFRNGATLTTITELIASREKFQTDRLTAASFESPVKKSNQGKRFLFCFMLRITLPNTKATDASNSLYKKNRFDKKTNQRPTYKKCILFADLADGNQLTGVILEESNEQHNRLFRRDLTLEHVAVGQRFVIQSPEAEGSQLKNGAWVITTHRPLEFVQNPRIPTRTLRSEQVGHEIRYYVIKKAEVKLLPTDVVYPVHTQCNFHSCDRQNAHNMGSQTNCACWMQNRRSETTPRNTVLMFTFYFQDNNDKIIKVQNFSSLRTSRLFFKGKNILSDAESLNRNAVFDYMQDQWRGTIDYVNTHGGWTIVGWYIRATIDDEDKDENDETLFRTNIKVNVSFLYPTMEQAQDIPDIHTIDQDMVKSLVSDEIELDQQSDVADSFV